MVSPLRILALLLLMLIAPLTWAVNLDVKLDSAEIAAGDTVTLTVTVDEQSFGEAPDFSPLKNDFEIISNRQSSQFSMTNGQITSTSSWILTLLPKKEGFIAIPPLTYGKQTSKPLKLHVTQRRQVDSVNSNEVIFMDAQVDKKDVYVQEQVIYTVRLYRRIDLHESSYTPPKVDSAVMEALGNQREYTSTVDGRSYKIIELRYAVFPQKSGTLEIPPAQIVGTIFLGNNRSFMFDPFNGRQIRRQTPEVKINVRPQPANYPADKPWLPARSLKLRESWTPDDTQLQVGEPVTRHVTLEAEGLAQSVLPPLSMPASDAVKIYPEQPEITSNIGPRGMLSTRKENFAIIATQAGKVTLPPVEVTWWDVDDEKIKVAKLPARTVTVSGAARQAQTDAQPQAPLAAPPEDTAPQSLSTSGNTTWQWIALVALLLWLATLAALGMLFWRRRKPVAAEQVKTETPFSRQAEKFARAALLDACARNDAKAARKQLIELYRQIFQSAAIHNLDDVLEQTPDQNLATSLRALDAALYTTRSAGWTGAGLLDKVNAALEKRAKADAQPQSHLAPLFPT
jgi:hypothetical protein